MARVLTTLAQVEQVADVYLSRPTEPVFFDIETTGLNPRRNKIVAIQLKQGGYSTVIIDVRGDQAAQVLIPALEPIFLNLRIIGHNIKFDLGFLRPFGIRAGRVFDTQIAEQLIRGVGLSEARKKGLGVNLLDTAERYGITVSKEERGWFYEPAPLDEREDWWQPFPDEQIAYMSQDVDVLGPILSAQAKKIRDFGLSEVTGIEMRALLALVEMEHAGIRIDVEGWRAFIAEKAAEAKRLEEKALGIIGAAILEDRIERYDREMEQYRAYRERVKQAEEEARVEYELGDSDLPWGAFKNEYMHNWRTENPVVAKPKLETAPPDIGSTTQLIAGLERLGVPVPTKKNDKGLRVKTTESDALESLVDDYPVVKLLLDYRKQVKFVQSFGETLLAFADEDDRIHSDYQQIGAGTGRMSCTRPNFQQIPSKGDGKRIRQLVQAQPGWVLLTADFSNIELRILANITQDAAMLDAFERGLDLHAETAKAMFGLPAEWGKKETSENIWKRGWSYRDIAKTCNFLRVYGGSAYKLAIELGIEVEEAEKLLAAQANVYKGVDRWMIETRKLGLKEMKARTLAGRIRLFDPLPPEPRRQALEGHQEFRDRLREWQKARARIERQSLNTPIQGTSADITKLALALFVERIDLNLARPVAVVHDEIVVEAHKNYAPRAEMVLKQAMKDACDTYLMISPVPMPEVNVSDHWEH